MSTTTEEIKNRLDVVEFISTYLRLQKAGRNFRALCPFHNEKSPSFMVSPERQLWHCFGCNESGDIFTFLMKIEGIEFKDALAQLAERAGVRLERFDRDASSRKQKIYNILEIATQFFSGNFWGNVGQAAREYAQARGLTERTMKEFRMGYSFDSWDALLKYMEGKEFATKDLFDAGLIVKKDGSANQDFSERNYYDRFRNRIMFPIQDVSGRVVGFSARVMPGSDDKMGKYINTPETAAYNKSRVVYALDKAKLAIRKNNFCILVEGQFDVIMSHQAGVRNVVATSGTALTLEHLTIIKRYTKNLALCFDSDEAGSNATKRAIDLVIASGFTVKIIVMRGGKDPADIIKQDKALWLEAIAQKKEIIAFYFENALSRYNHEEIEDKKKIAEELLPVIQLIPNHIERAHYLQELAMHIKVDEKVLETTMRELPPRSVLGVGNARYQYSASVETQNLASLQPNKKSFSRSDQLAEFILGVLLLYPEYRHGIIETIKSVWFTSRDHRTLFEKISQSLHDFHLEKFIEDLEETPKEEASLIIFKTEQSIEQRNLNPAKIINDYITEFKKLYAKSRLNTLILEIKHAEAKGYKVLVRQLTEEFEKISKEMNE